MNPVEIEQAISDLAEAPFDAAEFPYAFLEAFGRKETEIKKLRKGDSNKSDLGGVLQRNNIHIATCAPGEVSQTLAALKASPATAKHKAKFILATDGQTFEAEDLIGGDTVACAYPDFPDSFGVFLPLAGISTIKQIKESAFDIKATGRLNRLYMELLKDNPEWGKVDRRPDMNHFMARLIFCFFAEDTDIFASSRLFTGTIEQMSNRDGTNTHEIISEIFRAMNVPLADRADANLPRWADAFPYVNGGLFSGSTDVPRFSKIAQRYLSHIGGLDWTRVNPDIFGSMIQAVADEDERSVLGMHYTSVPNILKVLNPLFLDDLNAALEEAGDNARKLLNLRNRIAKIRVFDPACGSGNFLVIAGFVAQIDWKPDCALSRTDLSCDLRGGDAERGVAVRHGNTELERRDLSFEVPRHEALTQEFEAVHFRFCVASAAISTPSSPERTAEVLRCSECFVSRDRAGRDRPPRLGILAGRDHGMGPAFGDGVVALSRVAGPIGGDACDHLIGRDLAEQLRQHGRIAYVAAGGLDRPDLQRLLMVVGKTVHWTVC